MEQSNAINRKLSESSVKFAAVPSSYHRYRTSPASSTVALFLLGTLLAIGTAGYMILEGWGLLDSFFMVLTTVTTVGFGEVHPLTPAGRVFTCALVIAGVGVGTYSFYSIGRSIVEGELRRQRSLKKMQKEISSYHDHTIVCGFGRLARIVVRELVAARKSVVVIEHNPERVPEIEHIGAPYVIGSAYEDEVLKLANIGAAKNLLALLPRDADNVYITLCARDLNPSLHIVARTEEDRGEKKLRRAGADQVLAPYRVSGTRAAQRLIRPNVSDFLEVTSGKDGAQLVLEEVEVPVDSPLAGQSLEKSGLRGKTGAIIAAIIGDDGQMTFNPDGKSVVQPGTTLIVLGKPGSVNVLSDLLCKGSAG